MRPLSKTDWWLCVVIAVFLMIGAGLWNKVVGRRYDGGDGQFAESYRSPIQALRQSMNSVRECFAKSGQIHIEIKNPDPAQSATVQTPDGAEVPHSTPIALQGISWQQSMPLAMVNGRVYRTGDQIDEYVLEEVTPNSIRLRDASGTVLKIKLMEEVSP